MNFLRTLLALAAGALLATGAAAQSSPFPSAAQPRVLVPYPPGSGPDAVARHLSVELRELWGVAPVIENKLGASGIVAIAEFKRAPADGTTLLFLTNEQLAVNRAVYKTLPYDADADFIPLGGIYQSTFVVVASQQSGIRSMSDLIAAGKQKQGRLSYASNGKGSLGHLSGEALSVASGITMTHVPVRSLGELATSVGAGDIDLVFIAPPAISALVESGRAVMVGTLGPRRQPQLPNVPTVAESGGPSLFHVRGWTILAAPKGTPKAVVDRLQADLLKVVRDEKFRQKLAGAGVDPWAGTPEEIRALQADELKVFRGIAARPGMQLE